MGSIDRSNLRMLRGKFCLMPRNKACHCSRPFELSLPLFKFKLDVTRFEYSLYTCFEQALRNGGREPNLEVSVLFVRNRLRAINGSSSRIQVYDLLSCATKLSLEGCHAPNREGLHATPLSFRMRLQRDSEGK